MYLIFNTAITHAPNFRNLAEVQLFDNTGNKENQALFKMISSQLNCFDGMREKQYGPSYKYFRDVYFGISSVTTEIEGENLMPSIT